MNIQFSRIMGIPDYIYTCSSIHSLTSLFSLLFLLPKYICILASKYSLISIPDTFSWEEGGGKRGREERKGEGGGKRGREEGGGMREGEGVGGK